MLLISSPTLATYIGFRFWYSPVPLSTWNSELSSASTCSPFSTCFNNFSNLSVRRLPFLEDFFLQYLELSLRDLDVVVCFRRLILRIVGAEVDGLP